MLKELSHMAKSKKYDDTTMISKTIKDIKQGRYSPVSQSQEFRVPDSLPIYFNQRMNMDLIKSTKDVKLGRNRFGQSQKPNLLN